LREHTRLTEIALRWYSRGRSEDLLLRGEDIRSVTEWMAKRPRTAPEILPLQLQFIEASIAAADNQAAKAAEFGATLARLQAMIAEQTQKEKERNERLARLEQLENELRESKAELQRYKNLQRRNRRGIGAGAPDDQCSATGRARRRRVDRRIGRPGLTPGGFGRAIRSGLALVEGDCVVICMADSSDDAEDVIRYYQKLAEGYDCVFGSRFITGGHVENYPRFKLIMNRIVNRCIQLLFLCPFTDLTNAFKAYRTEVIQSCSPYHACHFNITIEMSLGALSRNYNIAQIPIRWYGRKWGSSNLSLGKMGRRYLATLVKAFAERVLITDDLVAEKLTIHRQREETMQRLESRIARLEQAHEMASQHSRLPLRKTA
jgi:dolichol-phosphate mannosyltransferase